METLIEMVALTAGVFIILMLIAYGIMIKIFRTSRNQRKLLNYYMEEAKLLRQYRLRTEAINNFLYTFLVDMISRDQDDLVERLDNIRMFMASSAASDDAAMTLYYDAMKDRSLASSDKIYQALMIMLNGGDCISDMSEDTVRRQKELMQAMQELRYDLPKQEEIVHEKWKKASKLFR